MKFPILGQHRLPPREQGTSPDVRDPTALKLTGDSDSFGFARRGLRVPAESGAAAADHSVIAPHGMPREPRKVFRGLGSSGSVTVRARVGVCVCVRSRVHHGHEQLEQTLGDCRGSESGSQSEPA
jgi:hypothetical protein